MRFGMNAIAKVIAILMRWWRCDQVRVQRSEGALLRVPVGQRLLVAQKVWNILERREHSSSANEDVASNVAKKAHLELFLEDPLDGAHASLRISLSSDENGRGHSRLVEFMTEAEGYSIEYDEVIILKNSRPR